jgi:dTDP-4-dehydrorhamnose 3,5-epimerase
VDASKVLITGANGQLGQALQAQYPQAQKADVDELDITDEQSVQNYDWSNVNTILNAAGYTNVDGAETPEGRLAAWKVNVQALASLARVAITKDILLVHVSTDYVFDGTKNPHTEDEPFSPLGVYGASKAAGDALISLVPKHYLLRTSWLIGDGPNFVRTMLEIGKKGLNPAVIGDNVGRPTFTSELTRAIDHLLKVRPNYGIYNLSNEGQPVSWANFTREIFKISGLSNTVTETTTADYYKDKPLAAGRPLNSIFDLSKIKATGFTPRDWQIDLADYIKKELNK